MRFVIGGASGFLGSALREHLRGEGHEVVSLVRREPAAADESRWDPAAGQVDPAVVESADCVVNLAGAPIARWPWTSSYKQTMLRSRVDTTGTLARAVAASERKPAFLAQNGIDGYGDRGAAVLTEGSATPADTTLGRITQAWEEAARPAEEAGARVCILRSGVVLDRRGGALKPFLLQFRLGLGGRLGDGSQYFSTISLRDWLRAVTWLATDEHAHGVYNLVGPEPVTNAEFTRELARALGRPAVLRAPAWPIRTVLGDLSQELLGSVRVVPERLLAEGFRFEDETLPDQLASALAR